MWNPEGNKIAFLTRTFYEPAGRVRLYQASVGSSSTELVTSMTEYTRAPSRDKNQEGTRINTGELISDPEASPTDFKVAFAWRIRDDEEPESESARIFIFDMETHGRKTIDIENETLTDGPHWSPDGKKLLICLGEKYHTPSKIFTVDLETEAIKHVGYGNYASWSSNQDWIAVLNRRNTEEYLSILNLEDGSRRILVLRDEDEHTFHLPHDSGESQK